MDEERTILGEQDEGAGHPVHNGVDDGSKTPPHKNHSQSNSGDTASQPPNRQTDDASPTDFVMPKKDARARRSRGSNIKEITALLNIHDPQEAATTIGQTSTVSSTHVQFSAYTQ